MLSDIDGTDPYNVKNVLQYLQYNSVSFPPHLNFDDNMLSFMEDFIRNRIERVNSVGELKTTTRDETSEYELEVKQRLFVGDSRVNAPKWGVFRSIKTRIANLIVIID